MVASLGNSSAYLLDIFASQNELISIGTFYRLFCWLDISELGRR